MTQSSSTEVIITDSRGVVRYLNEFGQLHRDGNLPAVIDRQNLEYYQYGELHRENGPAVINDNQEVYYRHGLKHREDGPAVEHFIKDDNGNKELMSQEYYRDGELHREHGPALIWTTGSYQHYRHGKLHNENGPACHYVKNGKTIDEYWLDGKNVSKMIHQIHLMRKRLFSVDPEKILKMQR